MTTFKKALCTLLPLSIIAFSSPSLPILGLVAFLIGFPLLLITAFSFSTRKSKALYLYLCGLVYLLAQMSWLAGAKYHGLVIIPIYFFLAAIFALPFCVLGYSLPKKASNLDTLSIGSISLLFVVLEYARLGFLCGFPFHVLGLFLTGNKVTLHLASYIGIYGLSFVVIAQGLCIAKWYYKKDYVKGVLSISKFFLIAFVLFIPTLYHTPKVKSSAQIATLQTGLKVEEKWNLSSHRGKHIPIKEQLKRIWDHLEPLAPSDLVVLPEAALPGDALFKRFSYQDIMEIFPEYVHPFFPREERVSYMDVFSALSIYLNTDIMIGLVEGSYTSAFYISQGEVKGRYNKRRLIPFGEYIPFSFLKPLAKRYGIEDSFKAGVKTSIIEGKWRILPSICFDEGFPTDFLSTLKHHPQFHVNLTNDAWFIDSSLAEHHLALSILRSVESGLWTIRACNTGKSVIISPDGDLQNLLPEYDKAGNLYSGTSNVTIPLFRKITLFSYLGNFGLLCTVGFFLLGLRQYRRKVVSLKA